MTFIMDNGAGGGGGVDILLNYNVVCVLAIRYDPRHTNATFAYPKRDMFHEGESVEYC